MMTTSAAHFSSKREVSILSLSFGDSIQHNPDCFNIAEKINLPISRQTNMSCKPGALLS